MSDVIQLNQGIRLLSGAMFDYNDPAASEVTIDDIASALSNVCRFAGHLPYFYSVAQHAVNVSRIVAPEFARTALLHDTAEAFTNDLPTPLKFAVPAFKALEVAIESAMAPKFGFQYPLPKEVVYADLQMLGIEKIHIKRDLDSTWSVLDGVEWDSVLDQVDIGEMTPEEAKSAFLDRWEQLQ